MKREDLYESLRRQGLPLKSAKTIVDTFFDTISRGLENNKKVLIKNFASFSVKEKKAITVVNNKLQKKFEVPQHKVVTVTFSKNFKNHFTAVKDNL